jgi:hypothetical protein
MCLLPSCIWVGDVGIMADTETGFARDTRRRLVVIVHGAVSLVIAQETRLLTPSQLRRRHGAREGMPNLKRESYSIVV